MLWIGSVCIETKCFGDNGPDDSQGPYKGVALNKKIFKKEMCRQFMKVKCVGPPKCKYDEEILFEIADECTSDLLLGDDDICIPKFYFGIADTTNNPTRMVVDVTGPFKFTWYWFVV